MTASFVKVSLQALRYCWHQSGVTLNQNPPALIGWVSKVAQFVCATMFVVISAGNN